MSLATITLMGNLGRDPEAKTTRTGTPFTEFSVAVSTKRGDTETTNWYRVSAWGKLGETLDRLYQSGALTKGTQVLVIGRLVVRDYTDNAGSPKYSLDVDANDVQLAGNRARAAEEEFAF